MEKTNEYQIEETSEWVEDEAPQNWGSEEDEEEVFESEDYLKDPDAPQTNWSDSDDEEPSNWSDSEEDEQIDLTYKEGEVYWGDGADKSEEEIFGNFEESAEISNLEEVVETTEDGVEIDNENAFSFAEDGREESGEENSVNSILREQKESSDILGFTNSKFSLYFKEVKFSELTYSKPLKDYREETFKGLTKSVSDLGIVTPIHVMRTENFQQFLDEGGDEDLFDGEKYLLLDGFRRIFAGVKTGLSSCNAIVWVFNDLDLGREASIPLSLVLNKFQKHHWKEIWGMFQVLEMSDITTPNKLEYLLHLGPGESMQLRDIMLSDYDEVKEPLMENKKTLSQSYSALQKLRKEEDALAVEDNRGISMTESGEAVTVEENKPRLTDNEVKEVLDILKSDEDFEFSDENFSEWSGEESEYNWQDRKEGDKLDENVRLSILERDRYTCQVSGLGKGLPIHLSRKLMEVHHIVPVSLGGRDDPDNLITLSRDVHALVHLIVSQNGKLGMNKETYDSLDEKDKKFYMGVMKYVNVIMAAQERLKGKGSAMDALSDIPKAKPFWELE